ncbi:short-chain dehydrogenase [Pelomonas sp. Root1217]|uniref:SDR family NAD(P)-dependent oxidoreductase n=1 Tax=Pelomonas sp. Root1217 TaxID=1736430 RepID=UPI00071049D2|nr:SDR family oxidoreductase [Pelomonas sp. Root1217]KQV53607.1 short-chain dehydrogenase [Pelomonas sp. Root1217]
MLLKNKVAVVYGAAGAIGGAVARAFAQEGAQVFVMGRQLAGVQAVAGQIAAAGGAAHAAEVDALDERAIDRHLQAVIEQAGRLDISFNAAGFSNARALGVPLVELDLAHFAAPVSDYARSYFLTARLAARRMMTGKSGVIMTVTALPGRTGTAWNGGYGAAQAAKEALTRDLSTELAPHGIRVVGLRPHGMPETAVMKEAFELKAARMGMTWEQFQAFLANWSHPKRVMKLEEVAQTAVFLASDRASGMTGTTVNLTMGGASD